MLDILSDAAAEEKEAIGRMLPASGGERAKRAKRAKHTLTGFPIYRSIADDVAHDTKKGLIAKAIQLINTTLSNTRVHILRMHCLRIVEDK